MDGRGVEKTRDAYELAVRALSQKERSTSELATWLAQRDVAPADIESVIDRLTSIGELDDERFAFAYAEDKRDLSGWGAERIEAALVDRGLGRSLAERAAAEPRDAQLERAVDLLTRRGADLGEEPERSRALSFLTRRGYEYELAYDAIRASERAA